jgi:hypothetical protein
MHLKVFLKLKKTLKPSLLGKKTQKNPKKPKKPEKTQKKTKNPLGWVFLKKTRVFSNPVRNRFFPDPRSRIPTPYFLELSDKFLGKKSSIIL